MNTKTQFCLTILMALALSGFTRADALIDDFSTGPVRIDLSRAGTASSTVQSGTMIGGSRTTWLGIVANPFLVKNMAKIQPGYFVNSTGFKTGFRTELVYGKGNPLNLNLLSACGEIPCGRIRVHFAGNDLSLNFNIQIATVGGSYSQAGYNVPPHLGPFVLDFPPFSEWLVGGAALDDIDSIVLIFQSDSPIGGNDFAITKIEVVP